MSEVRPQILSVQLTRHIRKLALLQLGLPKDRIRIVEPVLHPPVLLDMIQIDETTRKRIPVRRGQDTPPPQFQRFLLLQIVLVLGVQDSVGKCLTGSDAEKIPGETRAVAVDVVESGSFLGGDAGAHGAHGQAHAFVGVDEVGEHLRSGGDGDTGLVAEFVKAALDAQVGEPVLAVL